MPEHRSRDDADIQSPSWHQDALGVTEERLTSGKITTDFNAGSKLDVTHSGLQ